MVPGFVHSNQPKGIIKTGRDFFGYYYAGINKKCHVVVMPLCEIFRNNVLMKNYNHNILLLKHHSNVIEEIQYFSEALFPEILGFKISQNA